MTKNMTSIGGKLVLAGALLGGSLAVSACVIDPGPGYYNEPGHRHHSRRGDYYGDRDNNPPGPRGGPGTNWENPPGPRGGPGASPDRRGWY